MTNGSLPKFNLPTVRHGRKYFPPARVCIYCEATVYDPARPFRPLSQEHVVPQGMWGILILPEASCAKCEGITSAIEGRLQRSVFGPMRLAFDAPSKRRKTRPKTLPIRFYKYEGAPPVTIQVLLSEFPTSLMVAAGPPPLLFGGSKSDLHDFLIFYPDGQEEHNRRISTLNERYKMRGVSTGIEVGFGYLMLALAKMGHAYAIGLLGYENIKCLLREAILNKDEANISTWVGTSAVAHRDDKVLHHHGFRIQHHDNKRFLVIEIGFFSRYGLPIYDVVAGEI